MKSLTTKEVNQFLDVYTDPRKIRLENERVKYRFPGTGVHLFRDFEIGQGLLGLDIGEQLFNKRNQVIRGIAYGAKRDDQETVWLFAFAPRPEEEGAYSDERGH